MRLLITIVFCCFSVLAWGHSLEDFFTEKVKFNPLIPTPESVLGYQPGQWHVRHDQLVHYMTLLAQKSDRMQLEVIGYSHEQRPLLLLTVAAPDKLKNIDAIRQTHLARLSDNSAKPDPNAPAVVWMGYSVHGNEASGANAALLLAYYLAAAEGEKIDRLLNELVILLDPSLNPDGLGRFAHWANMHKGSVVNADPNDREHNEGWPSGRTNHYWFDLNRDWLLLRHPESKARVEKFHHWKPNVLTDFHEMSTNNSFFFQPGISSRKNPWTPAGNVELTRALADFQVKSFDRQGVLYFTEESFDDFYYGKGSTYPDVNGGVGILFEQASARGHVQQSINGKLTFVAAIKNQLSASLSTLDGAIGHRRALLDYQQDFYRGYEKLADKDELKGYVISEAYDRSRLEELLALLRRHQIKAYRLEKEWSFDNRPFAPQHSYYIPLNQPQYRLIKSIFSQRKTFENNTFYDVSSWNLAYAFNIEFKPVTSLWGLKVQLQPWQQPVESLSDSRLVDKALAPAYAYAFAWDDQTAPLLLQRLLADGLVARVATAGFTATVTGGKKQFDPGTIVISRGLQTQENWLAALQQAQTDIGLKLDVVKSGLTASGIDFGSRSMKPVTLPKILLIGGRGTNEYEVGEVWHFLNKQLALSATIVEQDRLNNLDFEHYSHIILTSSNFNRIDEKTSARIKAWIKRGGVIWGQKRGAKWLAKQELLKAGYISSKDMAKRFDQSGLSYADKDGLAGRQRIAGSIFSVGLDLSHPLTYGYHRSQLPVFKNSTLVLKKSSKPFVNVAVYDQFPQLSGYADKTNVDAIAQSSFMLAHSLGKGVVIGVADNVNFRGFWYGTSRLMANSLYFAQIIDVEG